MSTVLKGPGSASRNGQSPDGSAPSEEPAKQPGLQPTEPTPSEQPVHESTILVSVSVIFGVLMSAIDTSVVNVALPNIQGAVGATQQEITWISTGYLISVVILMPLTNWLSRSFGRKNVYLTSLVIFTASSFMCGVSHTLMQLIFWRVIQGFGAGTLQPLAQAIFREAFPPEKQGQAMGLFGFIVLSGPAIGPTLGGWITDNYNWPWIFFINLPIGIIGFFFAMRYLHDPSFMHGRHKMKIDAAGIGLLAVGLATMQTVLEQGQEDDWFSSAFICWFTVISVVCLVGFVWWELKTDEPAVELRILKNVQFASGTTIAAVIEIGLFASLFLLPQYMQDLLGFSATQSGLALMPRSLTMMIMMPIAGALYSRLGPRIMISTGLLMTVYSQWIMAHFTLQTGSQDILVPQVIQGVGFALVFVSMSTAALSTIDRRKMTSATGLNNLIRQLGGSFGTTIVVTLLTRHMQQGRTDLIAAANSANTAFVQRIQGMAGVFQQAGYSFADAQRMALASIDNLINQQAAMLAYDYIFFWIGILFVISIPLVVFLKMPPKQSGQKQEHVAMAE